MVERCHTEDELQAWICGELDAQADDGVERHVLACDACSHKLHALAAVDQLLRVAATEIAPPKRPVFAGRGTLPGAFAVAAALVLGLRLPSPWQGGDRAVDRGQATIEICAEPEAAACTSPAEPSVPDDALATFPEDEEPAPRGLCIATDEWPNGADEWPDAICVDGEVLAG